MTKGVEEGEGKPPISTVFKRRLFRAGTVVSVVATLAVGTPIAIRMLDDFNSAVTDFSSRVNKGWQSFAEAGTIQFYPLADLKPDKLPDLEGKLIETEGFARMVKKLPPIITPSFNRETQEPDSSVVVRDLYDFFPNPELTGQSIPLIIPYSEYVGINTPIPDPSPTKLNQKLRLNVVVMFGKILPEDKEPYYYLKANPKLLLIDLAALVK